MTTHRKYTCQATILTASGRGAVATLLLSGAETWELLDACLVPSHLRRDWQVGSQTLRRWQIAEGACEEVVVDVCSKTLCEVHCHGGTAVVRALIDQIIGLGVREVLWTDWLRSWMPEIQAQAASLLSQTRTEQSALLMLDQVQGALTRELDALRLLLEAQRFEEVQSRTKGLLNTWPQGCHLTRPWVVVLAGPANVGKSSLINRLLGYERSIVMDEPGTTRDVLRGVLSVEGWELEFVDTAGIRSTPDAVERAGSELAARVWENADFRIFVQDARDCVEANFKGSHSAPISPWSAAAFADLCIANKSDLVGSKPDHLGVVWVSAKTSEGCADLPIQVVNRLVPKLAVRGEPLLICERQVELMHRLLEAVLARNKPLAMQALAALWHPITREEFSSSD